MDDSDIPMLDVGDFEVLDECAGEEDDAEEERHKRYRSEDDDEDDDEYLKRRCEERFGEEDSLDNTEHVLDMYVDENDFLENVATNLSKNLEDEEERSSPVSKRPGERPAYLRTDLTDEELMEHFDDIENAEEQVDEEEVKEVEVIDIEEANGAQEADVHHEENWDNEEVVVKKQAPKMEELELGEDEEWYRPKIAAKEEVLQDKFGKLARLIQYSYPHFKYWMDKNEALFNSPICKIESSKHPPLDQVQSPRWKFICSKVRNHLPAASGDADNTHTEKTEIEWIVKSGVPDADLENTEEYPVYVMRVLEVHKTETEFKIERNEYTLSWIRVTRAPGAVGLNQETEKRGQFFNGTINNRDLWTPLPGFANSECKETRIRIEQIQTRL